MTTRFADKFKALAARGEGAFVPFVNLCDPDQETSLGILRTLVENGADALELGIPFSDPCADGPVIAGSSQRALANGSSTAKCFEVIREFRKFDNTTPIGLMLYVNLVYAPGLENFFAQAAEAGVDAVLIPDVPVSMRLAEPMWDELAARHGIDMVAIAPPNASDETLKTIAKITGGYTYLLSRAGITGTDRESGTPVAHLIEILKQAGAPETLLGFGVSKPEHVRKAIAAGADGVIVGSAIVRIIGEHLGNTAGMFEALASYAREMKAAARK